MKVNSFTLHSVTPNSAFFSFTFDPRKSGFMYPNDNGSSVTVIGRIGRSRRQEQIVMKRLHVSQEAMAFRETYNLPGLGRFLEERKVVEARRRNGCRPE